MRRLAGLAALLVAAASACAAPGGSEVVVGAVYPTGGSQGPGGIEEYRGVELAAAYVNRDVREAGRRVRLRLEPVERRELAPAAVQRLDDDGVNVIVGSYGSTISAPVARAAARRGLVFWETGAVGEVSMASGGEGAAFRFPASGRVLGRRAVSFVDERLPVDASRYAVAYVDDVYGRSVALGAMDEIRDRGLELVADLAYRLDDADYGALADRIGASGAQVLVVSSYLDDAVALRREIVERGIALEANIGTSSSYCMLAFGKLLGSDAVGLFASDKPDGAAMDPSKLRPAGARALRWARGEYRRRHGSDMTAPALTGFSGALALFAHVLPAAGEPSASAVRRAAMAADVPRGELPDGAGLRFAPDEGGVVTNQRATTVIWEWVARERRAVVWPREAASHAVVAPR